MHHVRGFRVVVDNSLPDIATEAVLSRLDEALVLLEQYEPRRTRHLARDLGQILISRTHDARSGIQTADNGSE